MIAEYHRKSLMLGIPGLVLQLVCNVLLSASGAQSRGLVWIFWAGVLLGSVLLIIGLGYYTKGKGYSGLLGLLGLLSCIGVLIVALLPDKTRNL